MPLRELLSGLVEPAGPGGTILSSPLASIAGLAASIADPRFAPVFKATVLDVEKLRMEVAREQAKAALEQLRHEQKMALSEREIAIKELESGRKASEAERQEKARAEAGAARRLFRRGIAPGPMGREAIPPAELARQITSVLPAEAVEPFQVGVKGLVPPPVGEIPISQVTMTDPITGAKIIRRPAEPEKPLSTDQLISLLAQQKHPNDPDAQIAFIRDAKQDPALKAVLEAFKPGGTLEGTPGGLRVESISVTPRGPAVTLKAPSATERTKIAELRAQREQLDDFENLFNLHGKDLVGPAKGRASLFAFDRFGGAGLTEGQSEFLAAEATLVNYIIKLITGAQMSEPEAKRIMRQIPRAIDAPGQWRAKMRQTRKNVNRLLRKIEQVSGAARGKAPGVLGERQIERLRKEAGLD